MGTISTIEHKWDGRIRSARELFRLLHDFLDKYGYYHEYHEIVEKPGAIDGTATFWDQLIGKKDYSKRNRAKFFCGLGLLIAGVVTLFYVLPIGVILLIVGIILMTRSKVTLRRCITLHVEGETYRAKAEQKGRPSSEVLDVASNCRVVFTAKVGNTDKDSFSVSKLTKDADHWHAMREEFKSLVADFEALRPKIELPEAIAPGKSSPKSSL